MLGFATAIIAISSTGPSDVPAWFETRVANRDATYYGGIYDPRTGYMLIGSGECDGAYLWTVLTRDRYLVAGDGYKVPNYQPKPEHTDNGTQAMQARTIPLRTGHGIQIGDGTKRVVALLGPPTKATNEGSRKQFRVLTYSWHSKKERRTYDQSYTFKRGRLIEMHFGSDSDDAG